MNVTPAPYGASNWRTTGTHKIERADHIEVCDCGPANHVTGPQYATVNGIEYRTAQIVKSAS